MKWNDWGPTVGILAGGGLVVLAAAPTLWAWSLGRYQLHEVFASVSPDASLRVVGAIRADFPATDLLDPSATATITLSDVRGGRTLDQVFVRLHSYDDFNPRPRISWQGGGRVDVGDVDIAEGHSVAVALTTSGRQR